METTPDAQVKVEVTDQDVRVTRKSMGIMSTSILHLGRKATPAEAEQIKQTVLDSDKGLGAAFRKRFGLSEVASLKLTDNLPKSLKENAVPTGEENHKLASAIALILAYIQKYPDKEKFVLEKIQRHVELNKANLKKYDTDGNGRLDPEEKSRMQADRDATLKRGGTKPPQF